MDMRVRGLGFVFVASAALLLGCGGPSTSPSDTPSGPRFTLRGTVRDDNGALSGVSVRILDGPNANGATTTDGSGGYSFAGLSQAGFSVRFSLSGYNDTLRGVQLTQDTTLDVVLTPTLVPAPAPGPV